MQATKERIPGGLTEDSKIGGGAFEPVKQGLSESTENTEDFPGKDGSRARARMRDQSQKSPPCPPCPPAANASSNPVRAAVDSYLAEARQAEGLALYQQARRLDEAAREPLEALAVLWRCEECGARPGRPCGGPAGAHAGRLEVAADARAEWLALRSVDGRPEHRAWDRRRATQMQRTQLFRAVNGADAKETR